VSVDRKEANVAELKALGTEKVLRGTADVAIARERARIGRVAKLGIAFVLVDLVLWGRWAAGHPIHFGPPHLTGEWASLMPMTIILLLVCSVVIIPMLGMGKSPHVLYRPSEIDVTLADVKGAGVVVEEVVKSLNLFLAHKTFKERMGGTARRAVLFEGPPGTGKTYMAKAMAREAGVPFLFVSSSAFQSMYYGQTNRKIRSYFKQLRKYARSEGGAIGFIEEIDAIGAARNGMGASTSREGISGVVNELLIQLQSFDAPSLGGRIVGVVIDLVNRWLPFEHQLRKPKPVAANVLVIGATNRAADLDPALLRPGRFDRSIYFDLPSRSSRREIIDYYLDKKAHEAELDDPAKRETLAAVTAGYSPVMIEHVLDEALVWALRRGAEQLSWSDIQKAKMTEEIGLAQPVEYTEAELRTIATHEAGHATVAHLAGVGRKLEVLSVIKRKDALGLLAHSDTEERHMKTKAELEGLVRIAFGGMVAEELFFGDTSTGVAGDLGDATRFVTAMLGQCGMAGSLRYRESCDDKEDKAKIEELLAEAKADVTAMLSENRHVVEALRDALLERNELIADEITDIIREAEASGDQLDLRDSVTR
jgi:ATP-dependent Zn protease